MSTELVVLSNHLILCCPLLLPSIFTSISIFSNELVLCLKWPKTDGASASVLPMNIQGWFPSGLTGLISLLFKGLSRVFSTTTIWRHQFFGAQPSLWSNSHIHPYMTTGYIIVLTTRVFVGKVMSLLFNTLSRFVKVFLPRSKHLLISWLQSLSTVILDPIKSVPVFTFPFYLPWSDRITYHDLSCGAR